MAAGLAGIPALVAQADPQPAEKAQIRSQEDPRIQSLRRFFQKHQSPAGTLSDVFVQEADNNNLDWRLMPGLALIETGGGKHCRHHNLFGWSNGHASFGSFSESIRQVAYQLSNSHYYRNKNLEVVLRLYNRNPGYTRLVKAVMRGISPTVEIALAE